MEQNRFKSVVLWTAVLAQVMSIAGLVGLWDLIGLSSDTFQGIMTAALQILVIFGVLNNPTNKIGF